LEAAAEDTLQGDAVLKGLVDALGRVEDADAKSFVKAVGISLVDLLVDEVIDAVSLDKSNSIIKPENRSSR